MELKAEPHKSPIEREWGHTDLTVGPSLQLSLKQAQTNELSQSAESRNCGVCVCVCVCQL